MERLDSEFIEVTHKRFTWPNVISASRIFTACAVVFSHYSAGLNPVFHGLVLWLVASDYLDGRLARGTRKVSEMGKYLDPLADKAAAAVLFLYSGFSGSIPWWFIIFTLIRDMLIALGGALVKKKRGKSMMAVWSGKVGVNILALYWLSVMYFPLAESAHLFLQGAAFMMLLYAFNEYAVRGWKAWKGADYN